MDSDAACEIVDECGNEMEKVTRTHKNSKHAFVYHAAAEVARLQINTKGEENHEQK